MFEIESFSNGEYSVRKISNPPSPSEAMHSSIGPWQEAHEIYILPSKLSERLSHASEKDLVVYDVGLGIAANALACLDLFSDTNYQRNLHLVSFENDLSGLHFAFQNLSCFPFLKKYHSTVLKLLKQNEIQKTFFSNSFKWTLKPDFRQSLKTCPTPDLIFYDLYSPKVCPELWDQDIFDHLRAKANVTPERSPTTLLTYVSATRVRSALLLAGFYVGYGPGTKLKRETTHASTSISEISHPLDENWLSHWMRSGEPLPHHAKPTQLTVERLKHAIQFHHL